MPVPAYGSKKGNYLNFGFRFHPEGWFQIDVISKAGGPQVPCQGKTRSLSRLPVSLSIEEEILILNTPYQRPLFPISGSII